ncbi:MULTISPECIES: hypothetical protein [Leeia]|uniref:Uncharacterized protein n=1 Tax=Leeia aquatica TaxID=2725557 RepID=A0A847SGI0_9NEIS|nr:hypothetical protein [Leeia aquatica]NLR76319.1 hypothetical protein [Leeia aquatica]
MHLLPLPATLAPRAERHTEPVRTVQDPYASAIPVYHAQDNRHNSKDRRRSERRRRDEAVAQEQRSGFERRTGKLTSTWLIKA